MLKQFELLIGNALDIGGQTRIARPEFRRCVRFKRAHSAVRGRLSRIGRNLPARISDLMRSTTCCPGPSGEKSAAISLSQPSIVCRFNHEASATFSPAGSSEIASLIASTVILTSLSLTSTDIDRQLAPLRTCYEARCCLTWLPSPGRELESSHARRC